MAVNLKEGKVIFNILISDLPLCSDMPGGQRVVGSNPAAPTNSVSMKRNGAHGAVLHVRVLETLFGEMAM
jgi:hypothetical protein